MDLKKAADFVRDNQAQTRSRFRVTHNDGSMELLNLGTAPSGALIEYRKGVRRYGHPVTASRAAGWYSVERAFNRVSDSRMARRNLSRIEGMLAGSGLWPEIREHAAAVLALPLPEFDELLEAGRGGDWDEASARICPREGGFTQEMFSLISTPQLVRPVAWLPGERGARKASLKAALEAGAPWRAEWHNRRDNRVECPGDGRAWYTETRSDRGDARRYILLDEAHALPLGREA